MRRAALSLCLAVLACHRAELPKADATDAGTPSACAAHLASYDALVASGGTCATDGDCACFNGGVSPKSPCGGVTDRATAAKLETLRAACERDRCGGGLACAAWTCNAACSANECVNRQSAPVVPPSRTACASDADCTYVSLGCCDTTPVNRAHAADAQRELDHSGRPWCPPKAACGPAANGTWAGAPGRCTAGNCVLR